MSSIKAGSQCIACPSLIFNGLGSGPVVTGPAYFQIVGSGVMLFYSPPVYAPTFTAAGQN